jgi:hypothetical protein
MNQARCTLAGLVLFLALSAAGSRADTVFSVDSSQTINAGADILGTFNGAPATHWARSGSPSGYYLASLGSSPSATGLDFNNKTLTTTDGTSLRFDLNGQGITDSGLPTTGGMSLYTYRGANLGGSVTISNVGSISLGTIDTHCDSGGGSGGGAVTIGAPGLPIAGHVRVDSIYADVRTYGAGNSAAAGGPVAVYGTGDVKIQTLGGTPGNIDTHSYFSSGNSVTVQHHGSFVAGDVFTAANVNGAWETGYGGPVTLNGAFGGAPAGSCQVNSIVTHNIRWHGSGGAAAIEGYTDVRVGTGGLLTYCWAVSYPDYAGNISIGALTNISGNIQIDGNIDASSAGGNATYGGALTLKAGGKITLASLDLGKVKSATLSAGRGAYITGVFTNFPTADPTSGLLDAATGVTIVYSAKVPANAYLGGATYYLKSGGRLRSEARGTVVLLK